MLIDTEGDATSAAVQQAAHSRERAKGGREIKREGAVYKGQYQVAIVRARVRQIRKRQRVTGERYPVARACVYIYVLVRGISRCALTRGKRVSSIAIVLSFA